ncbi:MAG: hypothetical protein QW578_07835 [Thermoplasmatales archaeon]
MKLRGYMELLIAKEVFHLTKEEMSHILDSFTFGNIYKQLIQRIKELM